MFPQMPSPMPSPTATPEELKDEMATRAERMRQSGRDPHTDRHGRVYTHISTPNVSNTIHGVYLCENHFFSGAPRDNLTHWLVSTQAST